MADGLLLQDSAGMPKSMARVQNKFLFPFIPKLNVVYISLRVSQ
jgi:hypothetical protein